MSSSLVNDLRKYRFKNSKQTNDISSSHSSVVNSSDKLIVKDAMAAGRKRIRAISDSSDECSNDAKTGAATTNGEANGTTLSVAEKERRLVYLKRQYENIETMKLQDALFIANWNVDEAIKLINSDDFQQERRRVALLQTKLANSPARMATTSVTNGNNSNSMKSFKATQVRMFCVYILCMVR